MTQVKTPELFPVFTEQTHLPIYVHGQGIQESLCPAPSSPAEDESSRTPRTPSNFFELLITMSPEERQAHFEQLEQDVLHELSTEAQE